MAALDLGPIIDLSAGVHYLPGSAQDGNTFIGALKIKELLALALNPKTADKWEPLLPLRRKMQRDFIGAKARNVIPYSQYLERIWLEGEIGIAPPITLFAEESLTVNEVGHGLGILSVPKDLKLIAIDGETQLEAIRRLVDRTIAADQSREEQLAPGLKDRKIRVDVHSGRSPEWASQAFTDINSKGTALTSSVANSLDQRGDLAKAVLTLRSDPSISPLIDTFKPKKNQKWVYGVDCMKRLLIALLRGESSLQKYRNEEITLSEQEKERASILALFLSRFRIALADKGLALGDRSVSKGIMLAAHRCSSPGEVRSLFDRVDRFDWRRGSSESKGIVWEMKVKGVAKLSPADIREFRVFRHFSSAEVR